LVWSVALGRRRGRAAVSRYITTDITGGRARIRERYDLSEGDALTLVDLDGAILLSPRVSIADKLSAEIEYLTAKACLSLDDPLKDLRAMLFAPRLLNVRRRGGRRQDVSTGLWRTVSRYITNDITAERVDDLR